MKRFIDVHAGEIMAGAKDTILRSNTNSTCMVFVAYDKENKIGGLAHSMFLSGSHKKRLNSNLLCDAEKAIDELLTDMTLLGAQRNNISIRLISGENMPEKDISSQDFKENLKNAVDLLASKNVHVDSDSITDILRSNVAIDVSTGELCFS